MTSAFDIYCLHEAMPGSEHTGYYIIAFDFVYVGNWDGKKIKNMSIRISHIIFNLKYSWRNLAIQNGNTFSKYTFTVRNLLMMSAVFSLIGGFILFIASIAILDALRKEDERAFPFWLWTMVLYS